jgi:hypothetical protein
MNVATPRASSSSPKRLGVNVFTAPGKAVVGERPRPFGEPLGWDPMTSTLIYGEYDAVLVDTLTTVAEAEALADWVWAASPQPHHHLRHARTLRSFLRFECAAEPVPWRAGDSDPEVRGADARAAAIRHF